MSLLWLPAATRDEHPGIRKLAFTDTGEPKGVLHTTESTGWPSYSGWKIPPQLTVRASGNRDGVTVRQHIPLDRAGFALRNLPGGVQTNTDRAYQVELVGTCERGGAVHKAGGFFWPEAPDAVLLDLFDKVIQPMSAGLGIPLRALTFQAYPASYGDPKPDGRSNVVRLSGPEWDAYSGWCGHQHVPENIHGDPGDFPWDRMMRVAEAAGRTDRGTVRPTPKPQAARFVLGRVLRYRGRLRPLMKGADVQAVQRALGFKGAAVDGRYGPDTRDAVKAAQRAHRIPDDGIVGPDTTKALGGRWVG